MIYHYLHYLIPYHCIEQNTTTNKDNSIKNYFRDE